MISTLKKEECCGCGACAEICPKNCIDLVVDEEGFWYPKLDIKQCVNCNACEKACPSINATGNTDEIRECYVAYANDEEIRLKSSSGGMFSLLAEVILKQGGVVFGAAFDEKFRVHHIAIEKMEDLFKLRGSKYVQSDTEHTFSETKKNLLLGRTVLYSGTACQIAGLKQFLNKEYENLYTIDVLCHGVPSPALWKKYIAEQEQGYRAKIQQILFREKKYGWKKFNMKIQFSNDNEYQCIYHEDKFMQMFLKNICLRPSCHSCKFKGLKRASDITIGDCWGIENYMPSMDDDKGTSVVIIHSDKGIRLFEEISDKMTFAKAEVDSALSPNADSRKSVLPHKKRNIFFYAIRKGESIKKLSKYLKPPKYKMLIKRCVGIIKKFARAKLLCIKN